VEHVLAIELLTAAQALDYRLPLRPGRGVLVAHSHVRELVPHREADYFYGDDIATCLEIIRSDELLGLVAGETVAIR
jgi:histidine ammonia-lyase